MRNAVAAHPPVVAAEPLATGSTVSVRPATVADATEIAAVIRAAFRARQVVGRPAQGTYETTESIVARFHEGLTGVVATASDGAIVAVVLVRRKGDTARFERVSVVPSHQHHGIAVGLVREAGLRAAAAGATRVQARVRPEYPGLMSWWLSAGFVRVGTDDECVLVERDAPQAFVVPDADAMRDLGRRLAASLRPGDVIIAAGDLGAGKTTLTQGIGAGLGVDRPVISPTFVLSRVHPPLDDGPALIHVDAYRLESWDELLDLDLDDTLADGVTIVEWGTGLAEGLSSDRLEIDIRRDDPTTDQREVFVLGVGPRWEGVEL